MCDSGQVPLVMVKQKESYTFPLLEFYMMINLYGEVKLQAIKVKITNWRVFRNCIPTFNNFRDCSTNVEIEGNALTMVKMLHADREDRSEISTYIMDSRSLKRPMVDRSARLDCDFAGCLKMVPKICSILREDGDADELLFLLFFDVSKE
ncbi:hypothetical protein Gotri_006820, partial [Gossypium trilobum]|nr:hypothetical protein [Gossypium trilobum]